jgi:hypothetical protein
MAITDIQISEELETNAPSIKYSGNEGPKSPEEEMMMADAMLKEEYEKYVYDLLEQRPEATPMSLDEFRRMVIGDMSGGQPLPQDPTKPVNPFQPKPTGPTLPNRQMAAYGGIMGLDGRRQYGIGSSFKKAVRKIIPNEVAKVAEVAAPFVAPFNPIAAGLMSGIGGFDRTGRIGSSLKSGLMNYGMGQIARGIGGAGMQEGFNLKINPNATGLGQYFSSPMAAASSGVNIDKGRGSALGNKYRSGAVEDPTGLFAEGLTGASSSPITAGNSISVDKVSPLKQFTNKIMEYVPTSFSDLTDPKKILGVLGIYKGAEALLGDPQKVVDEIMNRGEELDIEGIRTEVIEAFKDESGEKLAALRTKYPFLGKRETKDLSAMAYGGRIGRAEGGLMDLGGMEKDYRAEGGFVPIGREEKADDVPARLSVNEFVFTADAVRNAGGGDIDKGAEVMENMMKNLEAGGQVSDESQGMAGAQQMFETSERLSEVI